MFGLTVILVELIQFYVVIKKQLFVALNYSHFLGALCSFNEKPNTRILNQVLITRPKAFLVLDSQVNFFNIFFFT